MSLVSTDGGDSWELRMEDVETYFALDAKHLWAKRQDSLLMSTNGGETWNAIYFPDYIQQMYFSDTNSGIVFVSQDEELHFTTDGGYSWITSDSHVAQSYRLGIHFPNSLTGWVVSDRSPFASDNGMIARTDNGGKSWVYQELYPDYQVPILYSVLFIDTLHGLAAGPGHLLTTSDGGSSWAREYLPTSGLALVQSDNEVIYASGWDGTILLSMDSGNSWRSISTGTGHTYTHLFTYDGGVSAFARVSETEGLLVHAEEDVVLAISQDWDESVTTTSRIDAYPNPSCGHVSLNWNIAMNHPAELRIMDQLGRTVHTQIVPVGTTSTTWNTSNAAPGVYFMRIVHEKGIETGKVLIR
jgi:photosystem II stability/assembly factor-like uncharacterized protein